MHANEIRVHAIFMEFVFTRWQNECAVSRDSYGNPYMCVCSKQSDIHSVLIVIAAIRQTYIYVYDMSI